MIQSLNVMDNTKKSDNMNHNMDKLDYNGNSLQYPEVTSSMSSSSIKLRVTAEKSMFQSVIGEIISCLGGAVGTGNIWRFPRILASNSNSIGALTFYLIWILILFLWSIPVLIVEYSLGRFTRNSVPLAFCKFFGEKFFWLGAWMVSVVFFLSCYYPVILGWCIYYFYISCAHSSLPETEEAGLAIFSNFAEHSYWPVFTQFLAVALSGVCLAGGVRWIEKANIILVPLLLSIILFMFCWAITRQYAEVGIAFLFTPSWDSLLSPTLWIEAAGQNAFDTGSGMGIMATYSTFMSRDSRIVSYSFLVPILNNLVSLYGSITIFSTVFSTIIQTNPTITRSAIVRIMKTAGTGSTGLTFTWIPVLLSKFGLFGRILCASFFLCLVFAGISSLLSITQTGVLAMKELNVPHRLAVSIALIASALIGLPSAIFVDFLANQDTTWGYALMISGFLFCLLVIIYGPNRYRQVLINDFNTNDCHLSVLWVPLIGFLVPLQSIALLSWWIYQCVTTDPDWLRLKWTSLSTTLLEWFLSLIILLILNWILYRTNILSEALKHSGGCDPYNPATYENEDEFTIKCNNINIKEEYTESDSIICTRF
ncbi:putative sodium-dependent transporter [Schistosoma japonicum]|uniref:Putative sodium-dependent transporter n=1 Tax=Schistosoma japonicum TaxID=6182 RepID=A0A4Z2DTT2_SCHJA|nr:putative sodium-dependent transporter [Schistosoma japonicum]TNN19828.1 putative sodium-dependent transporter [Schistosoma japonicum]